MAILALWACSVSLMRIGSARLLIWMSRELALGYCSTVTLVMVVPVTLIWTCTGPQRVEIARPVMVRLDGLGVGLGVGFGVGLGLGLGVGFGVGLGVGLTVGEG